MTVHGKRFGGTVVWWRVVRWHAVGGSMARSVGGSWFGGSVVGAKMVRRGEEGSRIGWVVRREEGAEWCGGRLRWGRNRKKGVDREGERERGVREVGGVGREVEGGLVGEAEG
ncbi:hypothetical protein L6452_32042 [Arctium lappa]|uniref:Uncharacterized protein n=1 Tax=Arctium lappa TaxID=4217 RepID=A0ACB8Z4C5_ARCLA|nr:hypothetical protein L6452_32042 [Arctium lappa]